MKAEVIEIDTSGTRFGPAIRIRLIPETLGEENILRGLASDFHRGEGATKWIVDDKDGTRLIRFDFDDRKGAHPILLLPPVGAKNLDIEIFFREELLRSLV
ncbi:MAG: hypothetical protein COX90_03120 [Candidatus Nealsonbacteria bacterium CG_4_10_14_0_2_um_filter_38_17]|uniref:Uncharacterized protein n=2 Tax=Candidatus Nealsoniibacteriota TaxID=1817911 RepID=A0A2M7UXT5_9BACT|nr:MAG: hypothetical protein COX36_03215 [Candidatus Nealsonbacteria bacterium CG23_combo_of_CG06-09_8_20_14_all_38_19]PIZ88728.1 MAG: hypothetical protein COX90_03120 [Candidatus Nealsonbacteria bacterium CG_4_10_14_0_2_um_filter_38_17]